MNGVFLDDNKKQRDDAVEFFKDNGIELTALGDIGNFIESHNKFPIMLSDLNLDNISTKENGKDVLLKIRRKNPNVFIAIYSVFVNKISDEDRKLLSREKINVYSKNDPINTIRNLKRDYEIQLKGITDATDWQNVHYRLNKNIVLSYLENLSNKNVRIPVLALKKSFLYDELLAEVKNDSYVGNKFILELIEKIAMLNSTIKTQ